MNCNSHHHRHLVERLLLLSCQLTGPLSHNGCVHVDFTVYELHSCLEACSQVHAAHFLACLCHLCVRSATFVQYLMRGFRRLRGFTRGYTSLATVAACVWPLPRHGALLWPPTKLLHVTFFRKVGYSKDCVLVSANTMLYESQCVFNPHPPDGACLPLPRQPPRQLASETTRCPNAGASTRHAGLTAQHSCRTPRSDAAQQPAGCRLHHTLDKIIRKPMHMASACVLDMRRVHT
jgi:hypothetical protein